MKFKITLSLLIIGFQLLVLNTNIRAQGTQTFGYTGAIQYFTVPSGPSCATSVTIEVRGAQGGNVTNNGNPVGGLGASMKGVFPVSPGMVLSVIVGGQGVSSLYTSGGGGGSGVNNGATPLIVAGGGGGVDWQVPGYAGKDAVITMNGNPGDDVGWGSGAGGTAGSDGGDTQYVPGSVARGGRGWLFNNAGSFGANAISTIAWVTNGSWGLGGGGGSVGETQCNCAGGGGGYSGGGAGQINRTAGGGGSYNSGTSQVNIPGTNTGNGSVIINYNNTVFTPPSLSIVTSTCFASGNATVNVTNGGWGRAYAWSGSASTASVVAGLSPGIHTVTVSDPFNCVVPVTATVNIANTMTLSASGSSCSASNSASVLTSGGFAPFTYTWTGTAQTGSAVTGLPTGSYTVTVGAPAACQTKTASVNIVASTSLVVTNTALCVGYSTTLTTTAPMVSYSWAPTANILSTTNAPTVTANPSVTTIYTVSATNSLNCVSSNTLQLFVVQTQTVPVVNPTTCVNSTLMLVGNSTYTGSTYQWSGPGGYTANVSNPFRTPATLAMSGAYSFTVISAPGCTSTAMANATVFPIPTTPSITTNAPICSGFVLNLNGSGGTSYSWQGPNTFTSNLQNVAITNATNTLHSGVYTLTAKFATGCSNTFTRNILVRALPVPTITSNNPVCLGKPLNLFGTGGAIYNWTGPNAFASGIQNPTIASVAFASAGNYSMTTTDLFGCQNNTIYPVTVLGNPTITATGTTVCFGYPGPLAATIAGGTTFTWTGPGGFSSNVQNPTVTAVNAAATGIYTVILGSGTAGNCTATAVANINTIPLPIMTATGASVCDGKQAILLSNGAVTYTWVGPGGPFPSIQNLTVNPVTNLITDTYSVIGTAVNGCTAQTTATLQARPNPTVTTVGSTVCWNAPATLSASGGVSYFWTGPNTYTSAMQNPTFAVVSNITIDTYSVMVTAANSCTSISTATLTTKPNPTVTPTGTTVCLLLPATLSATAVPNGVTYAWTGPGAYTASGPNANITSANNAAMQVYTVTGTAPNSCTHQVVANLNTFPLPTVTATGTVICLYEPFTILAGGAGAGGTYTWTGPSIPTTSVSPSIYLSPVNGTNTGIYVVIGTESVNNCTNMATASVSTMPLPTITVVPNDTTIVCFGKPATLKASGGILNGYKWKGPPTYTSNLVNAFVPVTDYSSVGNYTVMGTAPNSCTFNAIATLSFYTLPVPQFVAPARVCLRSSIILSGSGALTHTWTGPYGYMAAVPNVTIPIYNLLQEGTYTLGITDARGCYKDTTTNIKVDPLPDGVLVSDNKNNKCVPYCANFTFKPNGDNSPITDISWVIAGKTFTGSTFNYCVSKSGETSVIGSYTNSLGCTNKVPNVIVGNPNPQANYEYLPFKPVESVDQVMFTNTSKGEKVNKWNWYFTNNQGYQTTEQNPSYLFENAGTYVVAMVATNAWGCMDTVVKTVVVDADFKLYVPNAFTPNGDGVNDTFQPKGRGIQKYNLLVYDRWGTVVFTTEDFEKGWDGSEKGKQLTDDVYTWRIYATDVNSKIKELTGFVTVLR